MHVLRGSDMKKIILMLCIFFSFNHAFAEQKIISSVGIYIMGDSQEENLYKAKERAREDAMRRISEEACVFVESSSKVNNHVLTEDEIHILSASILEIISEDVVMTPAGKHIEFRSYLTARVDTENIEKFLTERSELNKQKQKNKELQAIIRKLRSQPIQDKREHLTATQQQAKNISLAAYNATDKKYKLQLYQEAMKIDPDYLEPYLRLAEIYLEDESHQDFQKAESYLDLAINKIKSKYTPIEIEHLVNSWYIKNDLIYGDFDFVIQSIYEMKAIIRDEQISITAYITRDVHGKVLSETIRSKVKTDW